MPISLDTFERGGERYSIEERVLSFLQENDQQAYNVQEVTEAVMDIGWSESNVEHPFEDDEHVGWVLDVATVSAILDRLVDNGALDRRVVDTGAGEQSYYHGRTG
ncbi:hypothetical protein [Halorussus caseinilyticus]|uniref:hypothetical protein n=1 Tax=Halorussus caseinilyticus TaxID=3034025 RepID=UPI0023E7B63A|nr:hypothetical protein [Halorussus sp. DT72]